MTLPEFHQYSQSKQFLENHKIDANSNLIGVNNNIFINNNEQETLDLVKRYNNDSTNFLTGAQDISEFKEISKKQISGFGQKWYSRVKRMKDFEEQNVVNDSIGLNDPIDYMKIIEDLVHMRDQENKYKESKKDKSQIIGTISFLDRSKVNQTLKHQNSQFSKGSYYKISSDINAQSSLLQKSPENKTHNSIWGSDLQNSNDFLRSKDPNHIKFRIDSEIQENLKARKIDYMSARVNEMVTGMNKTTSNEKNKSRRVSIEQQNSLPFRNFNETNPTVVNKAFWSGQEFNNTRFINP